MLGKPVAALLILTAASVGAVPAFAEPLDQAVYRAVVEKKSPRARIHFKSGSHEFKFKPVKISRTRRGCRVQGQLSHALSLRPDDQYSYRIYLDRKGNITRFDESINRGGFTGMALGLQPGRELRRRTGGAVDLRTADIYLDKAGRWIGRKVDGEWERGARAIVVLIGLQVMKSGLCTRR